MKITKNLIKQIISEELSAILSEQDSEDANKMIDQGQEAAELISKDIISKIETVSKNSKIPQEQIANMIITFISAGVK